MISIIKPVFEIYENSISVILPVMNNLDLTKDETFVYESLSKSQPKSISEILVSVPFCKSKATILLKRLSEKKIVTMTGNGRGTKYRLN